MRRKNRQVTDWKEIKEIVGRCKVARLGMNDDGKVYVVPMNYGCETEDGGRLTFYFHCAREGRKMDVLKKKSTSLSGAGRETRTDGGGSSLRIQLLFREPDWEWESRDAFRTGRKGKSAENYYEAADGKRFL